MLRLCLPGRKICINMVYVDAGTSAKYLLGFGKNSLQSIEEEYNMTNINMYYGYSAGNDVND